MSKKLLSIFLVLAFLVSCNGKNEKAPAYIHIDKIDFKYQNISTVGNGGTDITDAWVYDNDDILGVFELPATIAVNIEGPHEISVRPGIKLNGISATRESFAFYETWRKDVEIVPFDTITLEPTTRYFTSTQLSFNENFEDVVIKFDSSVFSDVALKRTKITDQPFYLENNVGLATLTADNPLFKVFTKDLFLVPTVSTLPIYLEMDYKCNTEFAVSAILQLPGEAAQEVRLITLRSTMVNGEMEWRHIYLDLTDYFIGQTTATGFGFSFTSVHNSSNTESYIYLDNTKVVNSN